MSQQIIKTENKLSLIFFNSKELSDSLICIYKKQTTFNLEIT